MISHRPTAAGAPPAPFSPTRAPALRTLLKGAILVLAGWFAFSPALRGGWVWDDASEIHLNPILRDPHALGRIWLSPAGSDYFPLKTTLQWILWQAFGDRPLCFHVASLGLHLLSALLFWRLLGKLGVRLAWFGGLLFAVHPLAVESVAWSAELKNTLSLAFVLAAMVAYVDGAILLSWLLFLLAMLSKTTVVMFPAVILLYSWWKRGRITKADFFSSAPFFAVSAALGSITLWFQQSRAIGGWIIPMGGPVFRLARAGMAASFYLWKCAVPAGLLPLYPRLISGRLALWDFIPWAVFAVLAGWFWKERAGWGRHALLGFGFFALNLLPVVGFVPMAYLHLGDVADHLAYLSLLGVIGLGAAAAGALLGRFAPPNSWKRVFAVVAAAVLVSSLALCARDHAGWYASDEALWVRALQVYPSSGLAHNNLGSALMAEGRGNGAISQFEAALQSDPDYAEAHANLGLALAQSGRLADAVGHYRAALALRPDFADTRANLGNALLGLGQADEAIPCYEEALRAQPGSAEAQGNLGIALARVGRLAEAVAHDEEALRLDPAFGAEHINLANALAQIGRTDEAIGHYREALRLGLGDAGLRFNLAVALARVGRRAEAIEQLEACLGLRPGDDEARRALEALRAAP